MSGFDPDWLDLREPADHAARNRALQHAFADALAHLDAPRITDLGSGTGSTLRALRNMIPNARWRLVDHDPALVAEARRRAPDAQVDRVDLAASLETALERASDAITASALFDLVSREWIERMTAMARGRVLYVALTYNGFEDWSPGHPRDAEIREAFRRHQQGDKGFGPALGPEAAGVLAEVLSAEWQVLSAPSPWRLVRSEQAALMDALATGIASAAVEAGVFQEEADLWLTARHRADSCIVGHTDVLAIPK